MSIVPDFRHKIKYYSARKFWKIEQVFMHFAKKFQDQIKLEYGIKKGNAKKQKTTGKLGFSRCLQFYRWAFVLGLGIRRARRSSSSCSRFRFSKAMAIISLIRFNWLTSLAPGS